jgi:glycosyltransferase involved in cell wall biosynthesis
MPLADRISDPRIAIHPAGTRGPVEFLQGLDCFVYRVGENLFEAWGRVIAEAMAVGLPVVAERRGGYTEFIQDGSTGFLFDTTEEAVQIVKRLKEDPALRREIGGNARQAITELLSPESRRKIAEFYFDSSLPPSSS